MAVKRQVELNDYGCPASIPLTDTLNQESRDQSGAWAPCQGSKMLTSGRGPLSEEEAIIQMKKFLDTYYADVENSNPTLAKDERVAEALSTMEATGDYEHTFDELSWAAKTAWRNAPRCVGRNLWKTLTVVDERNALSCKDIFDAICKNLRLAYNGGQINPSAVVFRQRYTKDKDTSGIRVWNGVLLAFAGFVKENGDIIGDPKNVYLANLAKSLGWKPKKGPFELLPIMISDANQNTEIFELPDDIKGYMVNITHPTEPEITRLDLRWYAIPSVSSMMLEAGGIQYTCSQIAGFFQDTEISVMNLLAESRYNLMEPIGRALKLDVSMNSTYWKCTVATELTRAVYHSFKLARVSMTDHFTLADNFNSFMKEEVKTRGGCPTDWLWVVPPMSGGLVPTFHHEYLRYALSPSYEYQAGPEMFFRKRRNKVSFRSLVRTCMYFLKMMSKRLKERKLVAIVYATEGGTALTYARVAESLFVKAFNVSIIPVTAITNKEDLQKCINCSDIVIIIASTFGDGGAPSIAEDFRRNLLNKAYRFDGMKYAVFGLGSSQYIETFANFGKLLDKEIETEGGTRITDAGFGDDQANQKLEFDDWIKALYVKCCNDYLPMGGKSQGTAIEGVTTKKVYRWRYSNKRSLNQNYQEMVDSHEKMFEFTLKEKINLSPEGAPEKYYLLVLSYEPESSDDKELFLPGQHIGIFPKNMSTEKERVARSLSDVPFGSIPLILEEKIAIHEPWRQWNPNYSGLTLDEFLGTVADLNRIPANLDEIFEKNMEDCVNGNKNDIAEGENGNKTSKPTNNAGEFDSARFIGEMPTIKRRLFSIASCQNDGHTVNILIAMHQFMKGGKTVGGLTSNFVRNASLGEKIEGYFSKSDEQMKLPQDSSLPLLLVSAGSGWAPFQSFVKSRERDARSGIKTGPIYIFHGCRYKEHDFLDSLLEDAATVLNIETFRAYSRSEPGQDGKADRKPGPKILLEKKGYVQDLIAERGEVVAKVSRDGGYMYSCGGSGVVAGVRDQLEKTLLEQECVSLHEMISSKRYQEEKFG